MLTLECYAHELECITENDLSYEEACITPIWPLGGKHTPVTQRGNLV